MKKIFLFILCTFCFNLYSQDVIVKKDGSTILSKVIEVSSVTIKYKKSTNLDGPTYIINTAEVLSVNYQNGEKDVFANNNEYTYNTVQTEMNPTLKQNIVNNKEQTLILKSGTSIPLQIVTPVKAADLSVGQNVKFKVNRDISVDGVTVIPYGTPVLGKVYEAKKSSWFGTKGRLGIRFNNILLPNGTQVPIDGNVYETGTNRTALSVLLFLFVTIPAAAICGSKAQIPAGYETMANVSNNVLFNEFGQAVKRDIPLQQNDVILNTTTQIPNHSLSAGVNNSTEVKGDNLQVLPPLPFEAMIYTNEDKQITSQITGIEDEMIAYLNVMVYDKKVRFMPINNIKTIEYKINRFTKRDLSKAIGSNKLYIQGSCTIFTKEKERKEGNVVAFDLNKITLKSKGDNIEQIPLDKVKTIIYSFDF